MHQVCVCVQVPTYPCKCVHTQNIFKSDVQYASLVQCIRYVYACSRYLHTHVSACIHRDSPSPALVAAAILVTGHGCSRQQRTMTTTAAWSFNNNSLPSSPFDNTYGLLPPEAATVCCCHRQQHSWVTWDTLFVARCPATYLVTVVLIQQLSDHLIYHVRTFAARGGHSLLLP